MSNRSVRLQGTVYFNRKVNGVAQGIKQVLGIATLTIKTGADIKRRESNDKATAGQVTDTLIIPKAAEIEIAYDSFDAESLTMAFQGNNETVSVGGGTVTAEAITAKTGIFVAMGKKNITAESVVVKNSGGTVTYVEGTDYTVNYALGLIQALPSPGAIADAASIKVDFAHGAIAGYKINAGAAPDIRGALLFDGFNTLTGEQWEIRAEQTVLVSNTSLDLVKNDFVNLKLTGSFEVPSGSTTAYTVTVTTLS